MNAMKARMLAEKDDVRIILVVIIANVLRVIDQIQKQILVLVCFILFLWCTKKEYFKLKTDEFINTQIYLDFNECESTTRQYCDYNCVNKVGGYECSCPKGYRLMGEDCVGRFSSYLKFLFIIIIM